MVNAISKIYREDISIIVDSFKYSNVIKNSTILVTGSTGLIGSIVVNTLVELSKRKDLNINIIANARSRTHVEKVFGDEKDVEFVIDDVQNLKISKQIDFIIHCAAPTSSLFYVTKPVETISSIVGGTENILKIANYNKVKSIVFLSSLESYGTVLDDSESIDESFVGIINPLDVRSSYSLGKRFAECLCYSFWSEYQVPVKIARLTQVFGAGVSNDDNRVFAQFAKNIIANKDIVLHTNGISSKPYCYTTDAVIALFDILVKGENGEAYNVSNSKTYISIKDMANMLISEFSNCAKLTIDTSGDIGYAPVTKLRLNSDKLRKLDWEPQFNIKEMFERLIVFYKEMGFSS